MVRCKICRNLSNVILQQSCFNILKSFAEVFWYKRTTLFQRVEFSRWIRFSKATILLFNLSEKNDGQFSGHWNVLSNCIFYHFYVERSLLICYLCQCILKLRLLYYSQELPFSLILAFYSGSFLQIATA